MKDFFTDLVIGVEALHNGRIAAVGMLTISTMVPIISWDQLLLSTRQAALILVRARI
jgi:hypothetical protein